MVFVASLSVATAGCVQVHQDAGVRAKTAMACTTTQECIALEAETRGRYSACMMKGNADCAPLLEDKKTARRLWDEQRTRADAEQGDATSKRHKDLRAFDAERARLGEVFAKVTTCEALGTFEANILNAPDGLKSDMEGRLAAQFKDSIAKRRAERARMVSAQASNAMQMNHPSMPDLDDPESALTAVANVRSMLGDLRCYQPEPKDASTRLAADVESWAVTVQKSVDDEKRCRATPRCLDERAAAPICQQIEMRRSAVQDIARERSNPGGAVDLHFLHQLGQNIQEADAQLPSLKAEYRAARKKPFADELCRKH